MRQLADDLWVHEDSMRLGGTTLLLRMTIVRLATGELWVHSPTARSADLDRAVAALGEVGCIVGPNNAHNIWLNDWRQAYPGAALYLSRGIPGKIGVTEFSELRHGMTNPWEADLAHAAMQGVPFFDESVFLHRKTRTLIVTDLIQNHDREPRPGLEGFIARFLLEPIGFKGICIAPPLRLRFMIKDKAGMGAFIGTIRSWEFDRIVVTHGDIIERGASEIFHQLTERFV